MDIDPNPAAGIPGGATKRSGWVTAGIVIQALWMLALVALPVYLLILARSPNILNGPDGKEAARGIRVGALVIAIPALFAIVSSYGLWKGKFWGWWIALISNTVMLGTLIYSMMDEDTIDWDMAGVTLASTVLPILLLLPAVRTFYRRRTKSAEPATMSL